MIHQPLLSTSHASILINEEEGKLYRTHLLINYGNGDFLRKDGLYQQHETKVLVTIRWS